MASTVTLFKLRGLTDAAATIATIQFDKQSDNTFLATTSNGVKIVVDPSETPGLARVLSQIFNTPIL